MANATPVTAASLNLYARLRGLPPEALRRAREIAGVVPDGARWRRFLDRALGVGGVLLLGAAAVYFIAYNWTALGRFARLGLIEAALIGLAATGLWLGPRSTPGRAALFLATILAGALLGFIGQTYQTGADPWQLFAAWALFGIPWAIASGWAPTWTLLLAVANVAIALRLAIHSGGLWWPREETTIFALASFNAAAAACAEAWGPRGAPGVYRMLPRLAAIGSLGAATLGALWFVFDTRYAHANLGVLYLAALAALAGAYRLWRLDLLMLSAGSLSAIVVAASLVGKPLTRHAGSVGFLVSAIVVVGISVLAAQWIRGLARGRAT